MAERQEQHEDIADEVDTYVETSTPTRVVTSATPSRIITNHGERQLANHKVRLLINERMDKTFI